MRILRVPTIASNAVAGILVVVLSLAACGSAEIETDSTNESAFSASKFDGLFSIQSLLVEETEVSLHAQTHITVDSDAASVEISSGCNSLLGSYSFFDDKTASFTIVGGTEQNCDRLTAKLESDILTTLAAVNVWSSGSPDTVTFTSPDGDKISLVKN